MILSVREYKYVHKPCISYLYTKLLTDAYRLYKEFGNLFIMKDVYVCANCILNVVDHLSC